MQQALKEKLQQVISHIDKMMVDPDLEIDYCIPEMDEAPEDCTQPYILITYVEDQYVKRKIKLDDHYLEKSAEEIANLITFSIEQFKEEIDSVQLGG